MVYIPGNQTQRYPQETVKTTYQHFYDSPAGVEPLTKTSTFAKLYGGSQFWATTRQTTKPQKSATANTLNLFPSKQELTWSGKLPQQTYRGNGTFELYTGTYSFKSVKLAPAHVTAAKTEYQDRFAKRTSRAGFSSTGRKL